jgi:hypothetical protein
VSDFETRGGLDPAQLEIFEWDGFLAIDRLLDEDDLVPLEAEYDALLDQVASDLHAAGAIDSMPRGDDFGERFAWLLERCPDAHHRFNISLPPVNGAVDLERYRMHCGPAVFGLIGNRRILDAVESVIGPEIVASPVQQMRMKPRERRLRDTHADHSNVGTTTWHQDIVALLPEADDTTQLTVWVALTEATTENGCLQAIPGSHRRGPQVHCENAALASEPHVPEKLVREADAAALPVARGGVVLFHKMNLHRSLPNRSGRLPWSADLRYVTAGEPTGRPAFPSFVARSRAEPARVLRDAAAWAERWEAARERIVSGRYRGRIFEDRRWSDPSVC